MGCLLDLIILFRNLESNEVKAGEKALAGFNSKIAETDEELSLFISLGMRFLLFFLSVSID